MPTPPIPRRQDGPGLSAQTLAWLAERPTPAARTLVYRVWSTLTELERSGRHLNPQQLSALLVQLLEHQPSPHTGRCHACPRHSWRHSWRRRWQRPRFPCQVWIITDLRLHDPHRVWSSPRGAAQQSAPPGETDQATRHCLIDSAKPASGQAPRCPGRHALPEGVRREEESDQLEHAANRAVHDVDTHGQPREASPATESCAGR
jgi:hypothetical protein